MAYFVHLHSKSYSRNFQLVIKCEGFRLFKLKACAGDKLSMNQMVISCQLTLSSIYTHFNTLKIKALGITPSCIASS